MKKLFFAFLFISQPFLIFSQGITQKIRGKIFDSETYIGLPGANIIIIGSGPFIGTTTDIDGNFVLDKVQVGRISIQISYIGYENYYVSDILVSSGKEIVLNIPLIESFTSLSEIVIKPDIEKDKAINKMATFRKTQIKFCLRQT